VAIPGVARLRSAATVASFRFKRFFMTDQTGTCTVAPAGASSWLVTLLSGPDNRSIAIGRVLGGLLFVNLLICLPAAIALALWLQKSDAGAWFAFLAALSAYVPAIGLAVAGLVAGTAFTEPRPPESNTHG
jgi:hypothetical protein